MNIIKFFEDYEIDYALKGKNIQQGWVGICCPFCNDTNYHMGYNLDEQYNSLNCWKCGSHGLLQTIQELLDVNRQIAKQIVKKYEGESIPVDKKVTCNVKKHKMPTGTVLLSNAHKMYLNNRGFDPDYLEDFGDYKEPVQSAGWILLI